MEKNVAQPLFQKPYAPISTWGDWIGLWNGARHPEQLMTLLEAVFTLRLSSSEWQDRLLFLLRIADGHNAPPETWLEEARRVGRDGSSGPGADSDIHRLKAVAEKAFSQLCAHFFHEDDPDDYRPYPRPLCEFSSPELLMAVLEFFRDSGRATHARNLPGKSDRSPNAKLARQYVRQLIREGWPLGPWWHRGPRLCSEDDLRHDRLHEVAKGHYVALLYDLGELNFITAHPRLIDDAVIGTVQGLAQREAESQASGERPPRCHARQYLEHIKDALARRPSRASV